MTLHRKLAPAVLAGALALGGCVTYAGAGLRLGPPVVVSHHHVHGASCGHYRYRGNWHHARHHHHGPRCGHAYRGGAWVRVR